MTAICVVHAPDDGAVVRDRVLPPLPALGFDRVFLLHEASPETIAGCAAVLVVVSKAAARSTAFESAAKEALRSRTPVIVVHLGVPERTSDVLDELRRAAALSPAAAADPHRMWRRLGRLLTSPGETTDPPGGEVLAWDETAFRVLLSDAAKRGDFVFGSELVARFAAHLDGSYPTVHARADLKMLRGYRQFRLMRDYAAAAIAAGTGDWEVRRQYGQALIELKEIDAAIAVLRALTADVPEHEFENHEARGLLGRAFKQRYVDTGDPGDLPRAVEEYSAVFPRWPERTWQGVNVASCLRRAAADGVPVPLTLTPEAAAEEVLDALDAQADGPIDVWDLATRVEALVVLGRFDEAARSLDDYLAHPGMTAFEVSSTYRQFDEVLRLGEIAEGRSLLDRLRESATRLRAGGRIGTADATRFLVRVSDPDWAPTGVPGLTIGARLGTVITVAGTAATVEALLRDPLVISIEESRPAAEPDCAESLSFVRVKESYRKEDGVEFTERGAHALVAVIDDGIDVLHEAFLDEQGATRIEGVWDQTDPERDPNVPFGRLHTADDVARYLHDGVAPPRLARGGEHGTHVASIAVGRPCGEFAGGVAPHARLLVVIARSGEATGYSEAHLAALDFIDGTANMLGLPVVVNVSQGMNAGAHDGQSLLEIGFDGFSAGGRRHGRVVVKSAGNERDTHGHARLTVPPGAADDLVWECPPGGPRTVNLELWWNAANAYRFQLRPPAGPPSEWVDRGTPAVSGDVDGHGPYKIELVPAHIDNGDAQLKVQFACGGSARDEPDTWSLTVEAVQVQAAGNIEAWIERHAAPRTRFVIHATEDMTLSVPGTARSVITVGAVGAADPVRVGAFSSFGPTRSGSEKPDLCAPGVGIVAARRGSRNGVVTKNGTSMAAPHVVGAVALLLSRAVAQGNPPPTATQVQSLLRRNTLHGNTFWDRGQGYGVLDVRKLLEEGLPTLL